MHITLFRYLAKHFFKSLLLVLLVVIASVYIADFLELLKKTASLKNVNPMVLASIVAFKIPFIFQETYPFIVFTAAIYSFFHLSKKSEYIIMKASGVSIWQFMMPYLLMSLVVGIVSMTILNPISAKLLTQEKRMKLKVLNGQESIVTLLDSGLWFVDKTVDEKKNVIIHANKLLISRDKAELINPSFTYTDKQYRFEKKIEAKKAFLTSERWRLSNAVEYIPKKQSKVHEQYDIFTETTAEELHSSFIQPQYISIWDLPYFIATLQESGHSAKEYISSFYKILAKPFITIALLFMAAVFCLKSVRIFRSTYLIVGSLLGAFSVYCITEFTFAAGINSTIPQVVIMLLLIVIANIIGVVCLKYSEG
jgi:lipopolysaccharide export system permease protein